MHLQLPDAKAQNPLGNGEWEWDNFKGSKYIPVVVVILFLYGSFMKGQHDA